MNGVLGMAPNGMAQNRMSQNGMAQNGMAPNGMANAPDQADPLAATGYGPEPDVCQDDLIDPVERATLDRLEHIAALLFSQTQQLAALQQSFAELTQALLRPRQVVRGPDNRVIGIR